MRRLLLPIVIFVALLPAPAHADSITYAVSGTVTEATSGFGIAIGDQFTGIFTFCPAAYRSGDYGSYLGCAEGDSPIHAASGTFSINEYRFSFPTFVYDSGYGQAYFQAAQRIPLETGDITTYWWPDRLYLLLGSTGQTGQVGMNFCCGGFPVWPPPMPIVRSNIALTPVPEPTSLLLIGSGATALFYRRRVRATERRP